MRIVPLTADGYKKGLNERDFATGSSSVASAHHFLDFFLEGRSSLP